MEAKPVEIHIVSRAKENLAKAQKELREAQSQEMWYKKNPVPYMADLVSTSIGDVESVGKDGPDRLRMASSALNIIDHETFIRLMKALGRI